MSALMLRPTLTQAIFCITGIFGLVFSGLFLLKTNLHGVMLLCIVWVMMHAYYLIPDTQLLKEKIQAGLQKSVFVFLFFTLIGALIAAFTLSGAIPTLIYYGLNFISPQAFLPIGMILCSMMSLAIGSCWGTIGTMGVALMGIATFLHIPLPLTAGMIISGSYFGDKFSPISDTTILSALSTDTNLYEHIKGMTYSIIPAYIVSLGIFWLIGSRLGVANTAPLHDIASVQTLMTQHFHIGFFTLLPMFVMLVLSINKKPAEISMLSSIMVAILIAISVQHLTLSSVLNGLFLGPTTKHTGSPILNTVLSQGGISNMLSTMVFTLLILLLGGLLESYKFITVLFENIVLHLKTPLSLVFTTLITAITCNMLLGEAYLTIILTSRIFKQRYQKLGLSSCVLSKAIEEGSTFSTPLIPWTTSGAFIFATLHISPLDYLFWSIFNWVAPLVFLAFVKINFAGISMYQLKSSLVSSRSHDARQLS